MWADNETTNDLLGFRVHCDLIKSVVTDHNLLPVVMGVFGDWGGGKSSIMRMLEQDLEADESIVCLYFNGWMFEGYEDAKTALLTSILVALGEHKKFGPKLRDRAGRLLRRVKWMDLGRVAVQSLVIPAAVGAVTGGVGVVPAVVGSIAANAAAKAASPAKDDKDGSEEPFYRKYLEDESEQPDILEVRKFREEFEKLLADTDIGSLVILIDDLDRCLPPRIIDTLEAIKLFVAVPKTAFVIGADEFIVRHAIATRYVKQQLDGEEADLQEERNLTRDYLEKLVQIPYHLPRLSPSEMETYINLLLCQKFLPSETQQRVLDQWGERRQSDFYATLNYGALRETLNGTELSGELSRNLVWSGGVARAITEGLKGNPRQVKRMLNAMLLRTKLAEVAKLNIKAEVLAKLMVLEYVHPKRFRELDNWQTIDRGFPAPLRKLEEAVSESQELEEWPDWNKLGLLNWLKMEPTNLRDEDLRNYFWIARDRTKSTLSSSSMVSPAVARIYSSLIEDNQGEQLLAAAQALELDALQSESLLSMLTDRVRRHPDQDDAAEALKLLADKNVAGAGEALLDALHQIAREALSPNVVQTTASLGISQLALRERTVEILNYIAGSPESGAGAAAKIALEDFKNEV